MTVNRDTVAAALMGLAQASVIVTGKHGLLSSEDAEILAGAILAAWGTFHVPNAAAKAAQAPPAPVVVDPAPLVLREPAHVIVGGTPLPAAPPPPPEGGNP